MTELLAVILISTILVNNVVLVQLLGDYPLLGVSKKLESTLAMAMVTTFVMSLSSVVSYLLFEWILKPLGAEYLHAFTFVMVIAATAQLTDRVVRKSSPVLYRLLGIFLPLIIVNCAVLGIALLAIKKAVDSVLDAFLYGFGSAIGVSLVMILFSAMHERIAVADVPGPFRGASIGMITAGLMSLALMGFSGLIKV